MTERALSIKIHDRDNVAIVADAGGLPAGATLADGTVLLEAVPRPTRSRSRTFPKARR